MSAIENNIALESVGKDYEFKEFLDINDDVDLEESLLEACLRVEKGASASTAANIKIECIETSAGSGILEDVQPAAKESNAVESNTVEVAEATENLAEPEVLENEISRNEMSIKMEFSCSPERVVEPNMDYSLDDVVEICSIRDSDEETDEDIVAIVSEQLPAAAIGAGKDGEGKGEKDNEAHAEMESPELSNVMNDHNYTTQESTTGVNDDLRQNIIDHIVKRTPDRARLSNGENTCNSISSTINGSNRQDVEEFVDRLLETINSYDKEKEIDDAASIKEEANSEAGNSDRELFVQNIMDAFEAEDAAEDAAEKQAAEYELERTKLKASSTDKISESDKTSNLEAPKVVITEEEAKTSTIESKTDSFPSQPPKEDENSVDDMHSANENAVETVENSIGHQQSKDAEESVSSIKESVAKSRDENKSTDSSDCGDDNTEVVCGVSSLPENCSEPMEMIPIEERFDLLNIELDEAQSTSTTQLLLKELTVLVGEMDKDCASFATATNDIGAKLGAYMHEKLEIFRTLLRRSFFKFSSEQAQQTDSNLSKKHRRKLNKKNKRKLLASSGGSSSSSSSQSSSLPMSSSDEANETNDRNQRKKYRQQNCESPQDAKSKITVPTEEISVPSVAQSKYPNSVSSSFNTEAVYDDGVVLIKYLRSNVFSKPGTRLSGDSSSEASTSRRRRSSSLSSSSSSLVSDSEIAITKAKSSTETAAEMAESSKLQNVKKSRKHSSKLNEKNEKDKEIDRLVNLDGLMKRHVNAGCASKGSEADKTKTKPLSHKQKTDNILEFLDRDLDKDSVSSEDSVHEDKEEIITEKQYLERYNQDLKQQLLNDSSSDELSDGETDAEFAPILSDQSDGGNRSPLVDKFLKSYNVEDSDEEEDEGTSTALLAKDTKSDEKTADELKPERKSAELINEENMVAKKIDTSNENNPANTSENSDCELLSDNFIYRKRTQPKSLEKILSVAEKRKKLQKIDEDLISLSSESECSDVEAVDVEPVEKEKSRVIKPVMRTDQLQRETLKAQKSESERIRRLEKRTTMLARVLEENPALNTEDELVLDYIESTKTFIKVHPGIVKQLKPHQREGLRFMYDSCYGGVESSRKNHGSGCILAHCMGLGKTLQLIALMHTVISYKELKTTKILVLCPKSTVMNWGDEIVRWLIPLRTKNLKVFAFSDTSDINEKISIMREWSQSTSQKAGCLLIGYEAFRTLVFYHQYKIRNNADTNRMEKIRDMIDEYLLQPGADLVVCDEGHIIKNSKSAISLAVAKIKTEKRIVLTGTPIQNNLKEYYSMVNFIKPLFLGTEKEFANMYANPIKNGQHKDSSKKDIKVMKQRSFVLHKKLSKFVQRKEAELLKSFLPRKFEYVLFIPMTEVQNKLYEHILGIITGREDNRGRSLITDYTCLRKIWTHPKVLEDAWKNAINMQFKRDGKRPNSDDDQPDDIYDSQTGSMSVKNDWWRNLIAEKDLESILPSNKLRTMFEILRMCEENGEKCLIFSAFVAVLNVVEYFFQKLTKCNEETMRELNMLQGKSLTWEPNKDYFRLDGKTSKSTRHEMIKRFNLPQNTRARVFLISAKAGGQGINLIGANRVIILDTSWNPSNDQQNIFRIFRLGQKKNCYVYRLLAMGTMEEKVYSRSVTKQAMSFRVMDVQQIDRHYSMAELAELYTLTIPKYTERPMPVFPQDNILANLLRSFPDLVYKYHEHDSLLENKVEQELSEQEKADAWAAYERDLQMNSQLQQTPNMEDFHMKMSPGHMQNYIAGVGSIPGLDMQSLLNYRAGMNPQAHGSSTTPPGTPFTNSMLPPYNYNVSNQQYLDMLNYYRKLAQYTDLSKSNNPSTSAYAMNAANMYAGMQPSVSPHHSSGGSPNLPNTTAVSAHPLSALSDLSMYGLGMNSSSSAAAAAAATSLAQLSSSAAAATSLYATPGMSSGGGMYTSPNLAFYDQFQSALQNYGYGAGTKVGPGNPTLSSFANSPAFHAPRRTPPQSVSRKSNTPDLSGYRNVNSGGLGGGSAATTGQAALTSSTTITTTAIHNASKSNDQLPKSTSVNNSNHASGNKVNSTTTNDLTITSVRRDVANVSRHAAASPSSMPSVSNTNASVATSTASRRMPAPPTIPTIAGAAATSNSKAATTKTPTAATVSVSSAVDSRSVYAKVATSKSASNTTKMMSTSIITKNSDPQIRVKDMGQLYANAANNARSSSLSVATAAVAKDMPKNHANNINIENNSGHRSRQSHISSQRATLPTNIAPASSSTATAAAELLKARSEMQIIPTTSPPGTASISKQLSEISPSISLTAVRNTSNQQKPIVSSSSSSSNYKAAMPNTTTVNSKHVTQQNNSAARSNSSATNVMKPNNPPSRQQINAVNMQQKKQAPNANHHTNITTVPAPSSTIQRPSAAIATTAAISKKTMPAPSAASLASAKNAIVSLGRTPNSSAADYGSDISRSNAAHVATANAAVTQKHPASILRAIKKLPASLTATLPVANNQTTSSKNSRLSVGNTKSNATVTTPSVANAAQLSYKSKNGNAHKRSYSPTVAVATPSKTPSATNALATTRKLPPANLSIPPNNNKSTSSASTPGTPATTAFPVHLQRSNSTVNIATSRAFSPLPSNKTGPSGAVLPSRLTQSTTAIVTPKIASVASLNSLPTTTATVTSASGGATATILTAMKKPTNAASNNNAGAASQAAKLMAQKRYASPPTTATAATTKGATTGTWLQKRVNTSLEITPQIQQQQMTSQRSMVQQINKQNAAAILSGSATKISAGGTQIGGVNIRPIIKTVTQANSSGSSGNNNSNVFAQKPPDKRVLISGPTSSAAINQAVSKLLSERKRKALDHPPKDAVHLSKRPKDF